jgi:phage tail sheath protein FI
VVFEPNDLDLWERVKRNVGAFLMRLWADGALFGASPGDAYFVKCDEELNNEAVRDAGQLIVEVGIAPVKPAEFVIFRISQYSAGAAEA